MLDSVDLSKIVVSSRWKLNDTTYKYFCGYLNNDTTGSSSSERIIKPLCVILPQMNGYIKYFDHLLQMMKKFMKNMMKYGI